MQTDSIHNNEFDLGGGDNSDYRQNNVCVVLEEVPPELNLDTNDTISGKSLYNLLRGREKERKVTNSANDDAMLFKLLTLNEFDQAIVNISYTYDLTQIIPSAGFASFQIYGLEDIGLSYNSTTHVIEGVPNQLGTFQIGIQFDVKGSPFSKLVNLRVITLWKEIDPPEDLIFPKSNTDSQSIVVDMYGKKGLKNLIAGSVRGRSHAHDGKPRDDDFKIIYDKDSGWYLAAVADGAGSAKLSREGSRLLCKYLDEVFTDFFHNESVQKALQTILEEYLDSADENILYNQCKEIFVKPIKSVITKTLNAYTKNCKNIEDAKIYDFSTTCLISGLKKVGNQWLIFTYNVGDGAIALVNAKENYAAVLCNPDEGKYFGQTRFITTDGINSVEDIKERLSVHFVHCFDALILMTDGVSDPKFPSDKILHDSREWINFYRDLSEQISLYGSNDEIQEQILEYLNFWSIGNHDDRTLVVVY